MYNDENMSGDDWITTVISLVGFGVALFLIISAVCYHP